jgi:hypothetical protein
MSDEERSTAAPPPGIYPGVPVEDYLAWPYASNSSMGRLVPPSTPAHLRAYLDEPPRDKQSWKEGRALHACILEPKRYAAEYRVAGQCIATTKKGERCSKSGTVAVHGGGEVCSTHAGDYVPDDEVLLVSPKDATMARRVRESFAAHPLAGAFLTVPDMMTELSIVWDCPFTGVRCKARLDYYSRSLMGGTILDLKGTRDASPRAFAKDAFYFGYPRQSVFYRLGALAVGLPAHVFAVGAIEKEAPFALTIYAVGDEACGPLPAPGEDPMHVTAQIIALLKLWDHCHTTGEWPAYPTHVHTLQLEEWAWSALDHQTHALTEAIAA